MQNAVVAVLLVLPFVAAPAARAAGPEAIRADRVTELVARLSSPQRAERVEAERLLAEGDIAVLEHLPQRDAISDPAVRLAVDRIQARLLERRALQDALPTMIAGERIHSLNDLAAASSYVKAVGDGPDPRAVTLPDGKLTLWQAVDAVAAQLDLWPVVGPTIRFRDREPMDTERAVAHSDAFRFVASPIRMKDVAGSSDERLARVTLDVQAEPKLRPLFLSYAADEMSLSANGDVLRPFSPKARVELPYGEGERSVALSLDYVASSTIAPPFELSGHVVATVAAGEERFAFPLGDSQAAKRSQAGVTVELHTFERNSDGGAVAELSVVYDEGGPAFESHRTWVYHNHAYLTFKTANGGEREKRLNHEPGFSTLAISSGGVKLGYRFTNLPSDAKDIVFNYEAPTKIVNVPVAFEMKGLQLD